MYYTYPEDNRVPDGAGLTIQTALTGDNAGNSSADTGIKRNPRPIVDVSELPDNPSAPVSIPTATAPIPASNPLNGVLVTLATLGVITASAGALTMTSTALAKKREQDAQHAQAIANLQAEQALQAETASANYAENQQKQAQATATVVMAGKQSQANKNFWYAYAVWGQKVAQALARRRAEELARKRAEAEARARQAQSSSQSQRVNPVLALLAKLIPTAQKVVKLATIGVAVASLLVVAGSVVQDGAEGGVQMVNDVLNPPDNSIGLDFCGIMAIICPVGGAGGIAGESGGGGGGGWLEWFVLALATAVATLEASTDAQVLPYPQIGPMPRNFDDEYSDEIPLDRILRIPWADFMNPDLDPEDEIVYIYRIAERQDARAVALRRPIDYLSGLSFFISTSVIPPEQQGVYIRYRVDVLLANNYQIEYDGGLPVRMISGISLDDIRSLLDENAINHANAMLNGTFPLGHVTVYHNDRSYWRKWYHDEHDAKQSGQVSAQTTLFYSLGEIWVDR